MTPQPRDRKRAVAAALSPAAEFRPDSTSTVCFLVSLADGATRRRLRSDFATFGPKSSEIRRALGAPGTLSPQGFARPIHGCRASALRRSGSGVCRQVAWPLVCLPHLACMCAVGLLSEEETLFNYAEDSHMTRYHRAGPQRFCGSKAGRRHVASSRQPVAASGAGRQHVDACAALCSGRFGLHSTQHHPAVLRKPLVGVSWPA